MFILTQSITIPWITTLISFFTIIQFVLIVLLSIKLIKNIQSKENLNRFYLYLIIFLFFYGILLFQDLVLIYNVQLELFLTFGKNLLVTILYFALIAKFYDGLFSFGGLLVGISSVAIFLFNLVDLTDDSLIFILGLISTLLFFLGLISTPIYIITHPSRSEDKNIFEMTGWGLLLLSSAPQAFLIALIVFIGSLIEIKIDIGLAIAEFLIVLGIFLFIYGIINYQKQGETR